MAGADTRDIGVNWEEEAKHYRRLYEELAEQSQDKERRFTEAIIQLESETNMLKREIADLTKIISDITETLVNSSISNCSREGEYRA